MEIKEEWKTIEHYPDYMVSNLGRVKSLKNGKEKILKQEITNNGYCRINLYKEMKHKKHHLVHRLVCTAFLPNPENIPCANHKNEVKTDNRVDNLEWVTQEYNINYGLRNKKASKALKGRVFSQETKNKMSIAKKGKKQSQDLKNVQKQNKNQYYNLIERGQKLLVNGNLQSKLKGS